MSDIINQKKNTFLKTDSPNDEFNIHRITKISLDENRNYVILKDKTLSNSIPKSKDNSVEPNNQKSSKKINSVSEKKNNHIISHFIGYFFFNEKYIKEKMPEGNNYKMESKNYKLKKNCINLNKIKIEHVNLNKVNNILQDSKHIDNYINNNCLKNNLNIINDLNSNLNRLPLKQDNNCKIEGNLLFNTPNKYKFDSKLFNLFIIYLVERNILLNNNFINSDKINIMENKKEKEKSKTPVNDNSDIKSKKILMIRPGDWYCGYCKNLNFSFRNFCNRCRLCKSYWY